MKLACQNIKSNTRGPQAKLCTQDSGHECNIHWKYNCCASDCPNWRLHAGHLRCRVEIRMSIHDLQNATRRDLNKKSRGSMKNALCRHFVSIVERMFCLHVEHLRMLCGLTDQDAHGLRLSHVWRSPCICLPPSAVGPPSVMTVRVYSLLPFSAAQ
jgi:hypothetical protein